MTALDPMHLFDPPGPRARRLIAWWSLAALVGAAAIGVLVVSRLAAVGQLDSDRWRPFLTVPYLRVLGEGIAGTLRAAALASLIAFPAGIMLGIMRSSALRGVRWVARAYVEIFRTVPPLLLIFAFLLALPTLGINVPILWKLVLPIAIVNAALIAVVVRAGILALHSGQTMAAEALGLRRSQTLRLILLPQALRATLPALITQFILVLKDSTLGYVVSYPELLKQATFITARTGLLLQTYVIIAVVYIVINAALGHVTVVLERRLARPRRSHGG